MYFQIFMIISLYFKILFDITINFKARNNIAEKSVKANIILKHIELLLYKRMICFTILYVSPLKVISADE